MPKFCNLAIALLDGVGKYGIPEIAPSQKCDVTNWIGFNYVKSWESKADKSTGVHFFIDDYQFERVWNAPDKYLNVLSRYGCVLSPDFSTFPDFPLAVNLYNHYKKHWLAAYWQQHGINVIPSICWGGEDSYEWCFDGEPKNSIVAVSDVGNRRSKADLQGFLQGYNEMLKRLNPSKVLMYTRSFNANYEGNVKYIRYNVSPVIRGKGEDQDAW